MRSYRLDVVAKLFQKPPDRSRRGEAGALFALGFPLAGSHLAQMSIQVSDTVMLGWYDITSLAAASVAGPIIFVLFILGSGFAWAVMPMVASAAGTADDRQVRRVTRMAIWLSILFSFVAMPVLFFGQSFLLSIGQEPDVSELAGIYMAIMGLGLLPALLTMVMKSYLSALELTRSILTITLFSSALNILLNYMLIFGNWGMPELGIAGAAIASLVGHWTGLVALIVYAVIKTPEYTLFTNFHRPDWEAFVRVFRLGWPIGMTSLAEVAFFAASSVMMGWVGKIALASHGIALQIASVTFMIHMGLSQAATVRVGKAWGQSNLPLMREASKSALMMSMGAVLLTVAAFLLMPQTLISFFIDPQDPQRPVILATGVAFLTVAALFQTVDAAQVMALGMLRGVHDTRIPMVQASVSYWLIGVPASYILAFVFDMGGVGIWLGLSVGLASAGIMMQYRYWTRFASKASSLPRS